MNIYIYRLVNNIRNSEITNEKFSDQKAGTST